MRLNSYISGLQGGLGDDSEDSDIDWEALGEADYSSAGIPTYSSEASGTVGYNSNPNTLPSVSISTTSSATDSWTSLLQSVIGTGVATASKIAIAQDSVPNVAAGETYSYNAKTGSYVVSNNAGSVISSGASVLSPGILLIGGAALLLLLVAKKH